MKTPEQSSEVGSTQPEANKEDAMKNEVKPEAKPSAAQSDSASTSTDAGSKRERKYDTKASEKEAVAVDELTEGVDDDNIRDKVSLMGPALALLIAAPPKVFSALEGWNQSRSALERAEEGIAHLVGMVAGVLKATPAGKLLWFNCQRSRTWKTVTALTEKLPTSTIALPTDLLAQFNAQAPSVIAAGQADASAKRAFKDEEANFTAAKVKFRRLTRSIRGLVRAYKLARGLPVRKSKSSRSGAGDGDAPPATGSHPPPPVAQPPANPGGGVAARE